jgi:hypothetical protein
MTRARLVRSALPAPFERDPMTSVDARERGLHGTRSPGGVADENPVDDVTDRDSLDGTDLPEDGDNDA